MKNYDVVIIGAGPAGLTAGLYAVRTGLKTAVISKDIGGTTNSILMLENWPGFKGSGSLLMKQFYDQLKEYEVDFLMKEVQEIEKKSDKEFIIQTKKDKIKTKSIIITTGTQRRKLHIPGEKEFTGKGVSYCVSCDGFFFKDKIVGVVGGSDCAAVSALALSDIAKKVYIFYRGEKLRCEDINTKRLEEKENVEIFYCAVPKEIKGKEMVEKLVIEQNSEEKEVELDGIFIEIGALALNNFTKDLDLKLNKEGYIVVNEKMQTSVKGIYAAGDVTQEPLKQVVVASGQGAIAAKNAYDYLKG